jgi:hypothetical protein
MTNFKRFPFQINTIHLLITISCINFCIFVIDLHLFAGLDVFPLHSLHITYSKNWSHKFLDLKQGNIHFFGARIYLVTLLTLRFSVYIIIPDDHCSRPSEINVTHITSSPKFPWEIVIVCQASLLNVVLLFIRSSCGTT